MIITITSQYYIILYVLLEKMKKNSIYLILLLLCLLPVTARANGKMPIIAYWGVPDYATSDEAFRTFSECGFTVSLYPYSSYDKLLKACKIAEKYGVGIIGNCPELHSKTTTVARTLKQENGFFGYLIQDEPTVPQMRQQQQLISRIKNTDSTHCFYINLFPLYNAAWIEPSTKAKNYPEYLKAAAATSCQQISFDHYPVTTNGIRPTWYQNLEMVRNESLSSGKPFWAFVLSTAHDVPFNEGNYYPVATLSSLRLQIYSNLAYGAQAIQYFTYWNPGENDKWHYHDAPVTTSGKKTNTWYVVQQMNQELKTIAKLFYGAKVTSVKHMKVIPQGCSKQTSIPVNLSSLKIVSSKGAVISQFEKNGHTYLAVVNKDLQASMRLLVKAKNSTPRQLTKKLQEKSMKSYYDIDAGDILLFRLS